MEQTSYHLLLSEQSCATVSLSRHQQQSTGPPTQYRHNLSATHKILTM